MQLAPDGTVIVSATDLVGYLACDHLATLELGRVEGLWERPPRRADLTVQLMQDRGDEHERAHLDHLRDQGRSVVEIDQEGLTTPERLRAAEAATLTAMRSGADVVYQATFFDGRWRGHADFLYRVERPSPVLGEWSYDIADTKLSRGVKAAAIIQMCVYAELLERVQGCPPETVYVVTGDGVEHAHRLDDYQAYYQHAKARFEERVLGGSGALPTYPDPVAHCQVCVWYPTCIQRRRDDDHPSIVAGMRRVDTERFQEAGIPTLAAIAALPQDAEVADVDARRLDRLHRQARLQLHERETGERVFELMPPLPDEPGRGLAALPERSEWDVFLDIEADPWALDGGLEYLLGLALPAGDPTARPEYRALWGHDRVGEKAAFEALIDLVVDRLESHPEMHVYHYGGYESGALKRLMQRYATREAEVDRLLRGGILVDLLNVVRQGLRASVESYSLKQIEKFYMPVREGPVTEAGFSVVEYERWMREGDPSILQAIADYNRDDCVSTLLLRDWLEERRSDATVEYPEADWSRPQPRDGSPTLQQTERQAAVTRRVEALTAGIPVDPAARSGEQQARWLLAQLLDWHWRDEKPAWWLWHDLRQTSVEDLIHRSEGIGGLEFVGDVGVDHRSTIRRYRYPPQDHKFAVGDEPIDPDHGGDFGEGVGRVAAIDDVHGLIDIVRGPTRLAYHPTRLIPGTPRGSGPMPEALLRVADSVLASGIEGPGRYRAARDLLLRLPPRVVGTPEYAPLKLSTETTLDAARRLGAALDETVLPIQGPPGTGKTYTGARMIVELVRMGRRVGVSAQSHKAITNLLREICRAAEGAGTPIRVIQKCDNGDEVEDVPSVRVVTDNKPMPEALENGEVDVVAGTAWLLARPELEGRLDVLFIDEAGQLSLANAVAMSGCARNLVLLGDPNQLPQVSQGTHPEGAGASALEHLLAGAATIDERRGLFLETTWRMHPAVNDYVSSTFYEGRLETDPSLVLQQIDGDDPTLSGAGIRFVGLAHEGNGPRSREEAEAVADAIERLVGRPWTDRHGVTRPLALDDIIVVAPYNAHVALVRAAVERHLGGAAPRVGTVDKFQGQEGAVAIYSMASSSREDAPRDMDFLYSRNRLNVAVSRARSIALVVASPRLLEADCRTPEQIRLVNALCRLVDAAKPYTDGSRPEVVAPRDLSAGAV